MGDRCIEEDGKQDIEKVKEIVNNWKQFGCLRSMRYICKEKLNK